MGEDDGGHVGVVGEVEDADAGVLSDHYRVSVRAFLSDVLD